jgi:hypothetical protein
MRGVGKQRIASAALAMVMVTLASAVVVAAPIRIGSFAWEEVDDFLCDPSLPGACVRFDITNEVDQLSDAERLQLNLNGTESFLDASLVEGPEFIGEIFAGGSAAPVVRWAAFQASLTFVLPGTMSGLLVAPVLSGPTLSPLAIEVEPSAATPVPEPGTLGLLALGLGAAWARRRSSPRP